MEKLGEKIKELRTNEKLSQPELAKIIGVSNGIISIWENNINEPKATYIKKLAQYFNVTTDYLLGLEDETGAKIRTTVTYNNSTHIGDNNILTLILLKF